MPEVLDIKDLDQKWGNAFDQFKKTNDERISKIEKAAGTAELQTKLSKIESDIEKFEKSYFAAKQREDAEKLAAGLGLDTDKEKSALRKKAFNEMLRFNRIVTKGLEEHVRKDVDPDGQKDLNLGNDQAAAYLAPLEFIAEIIKGVILYSPLRQLARVFTTSRSAIQIPKKSGSITAAWGGEKVTRAENTGLTYDLEQVTAHKLVAKMIVSTEQLEDSVFNIEQLIQEEIQEQFGRAEGTAFISGTGVKQPEGISSIATLRTFADTSTHLLADTDLVSMQYDLPEPYQAGAAWLLLWAQLGKIRKMKDSATGQYLMAPLSQGMPPTILGKPYYPCPDLLLDGTAAGRLVALYGDYKRAYAVLDRVDISIMRDPYAAAATDQIVFWARKRVGGQGLLAEAVIKGVTG